MQPFGRHSVVARHRRTAVGRGTSPDARRAGAKGGKLSLDLQIGSGDIETHLNRGGAPSLREIVRGHVITSAALIVTRAQAIGALASSCGAARRLRRAPTDKFLFAGAGLGDVARRFYKTNTYTALESLAEPISVICYSHNPSALEFFRFHPNHRNIVLFDMAHLHIALARDRRVERKDRNRLLFEACGFLPEDDVTERRLPSPIRTFYSPDAVEGNGGHIVVHPFGRGWGNWPEHITEALLDAVAAANPALLVYVICADYVTADGRRKDENVFCTSPNVVRLRNLSAPATFSLVATASRFLGTFSSLSQVAAFERVPSIVLYPGRCKDFEAPMTPYAQSVWDGNGIALPYEPIEPAAFREIAAEFVADAPAEVPVAERFRHLAQYPGKDPPACTAFST